jgi:hypothetical protein
VLQLADTSDTAVRDLAHKILVRPEYADARPGAIRDWLVSTVHRIFEFLAKLEVLHATAPGLYWLMVAGIFAVFFILVAHISWTISAALRAPKAPEPRPSGAAVRDSALEAERLAASGRYLEAAHNLMIASFRMLAERSVIELRPDRSNRWIRRALRNSKLNEDLVKEIDALVALTERHWFGDRENSQAIYSQWRSAFDEISRGA